MAHGGLASAFDNSGADSPAEQGGKKDKPFGCCEISEWLIDVCAEIGWQMGTGHPHQHQSAQRIELFDSSLHFLPIRRRIRSVRIVSRCAASGGQL
jgi:hypothetical protein